MPLYKEPRDHCGLNEQGQKDHLQQQPVTLPEGGIAELESTLSRQTGLADAPTLHFPPVELRHRECYRRCFYVASPFTAKNADGHLGSTPAPLKHGKQWPTDNAVTKE